MTLVSALLVLASGALVQASPGVLIRGVVLDSAGAPVPGARVAARTTPPAHAVTGADGRFELAVPAGDVQLQISADGFETLRRSLAAGAPASGNVQFTLDPQAVRETVVVTATRGPMAAEIAAPITIRSAADLDAAASPALDDVLRAVPGFSLFRRTSSRAANPTAQGATLRGLAASGASRALVLADGAPLNDPFGGWVYWNRVPQAAIDRVEVVRGGASDLYGADALAGVIQVLARRPAVPTLQGAIEVASHATPKASVFAATGRDGWHGSMAGEASRTDGTFVVARDERGAVDTRAGSDYLSGHIGGGYTAASGWLVRARGEAYGESRENGTPLQVNSTGLRQARLDAGSPFLGGQVEAYGQAGDQVYRQSFSSIGAGRASETLTVRQRVPASQYSAGVTWRTIAGNADVLVGSETREIVATNDETSFAPDGGVRVQSSTRGFQRSTGAFGQLRAALGGRTTFVTGARVDLWERERGLAQADVVLSPRVSVSTRILRAITVRGALTQSFRAPTLNERYRAFRVGNVVTQANSGLDPETLLTGEIGARIDHQRGSLLLTAFASDLDEAITNVTVSSTPQLIVRRRENAGSVHARGLEAEGEYRLTSTLTATATLALTRSRFADTPALTGNHVPQVPRWQLGTGFRWMARAGLTVQGQVRGFGEQFEDDRNTLVLRSAALVDASASCLIGRGASIFGAVENVFDVEYDTGRTPTRTVGMPITARVGLRVALP